MVGLGILGQLTVQMLRANGCRVIGTDTDRARITMATSLGMEHGHHPDDADLDAVARLTDGGLRVDSRTFIGTIIHCR